MSHPMLRSMLIVTALALSSAAQPADAPAAEVAAAPINVYDTTLAAGWQNWSWAKAELSVELNGSTRKPIKVEAGPWAALYLHHDAFSTAGLKKISMLIQASVPEADVKIVMLTDGKANGEGHTIKINNKGWTKVVTPLATLAAEDKMIDGIWVQNASGADLPPFYVTEIVID
jgi:hypothetical protein